MAALCQSLSPLITLTGHDNWAGGTGSAVIQWMTARSHAESGNATALQRLGPGDEEKRFVTRLPPLQKNGGAGRRVTNCFGQFVEEEMQPNSNDCNLCKGPDAKSFPEG